MALFIMGYSNLDVTRNKMNQISDMIEAKRTVSSSGTSRVILVHLSDEI